jgi:hypothetical protein
VNRDGTAQQIAITLALTKMGTNSTECCGQGITGTQQPSSADDVATSQQQEDF